MPQRSAPTGLRKTALIVLPAVCLMLLSADVGQADLIKLGSGGELRGKLAKGSATREFVTLETLTGAEVTVARDAIQFLTMRPVTVEEYESRLHRLPNTAEAHWEMAAWCKAHSLIKQRDEHLERVVKLEPGHAAAHQKLHHMRLKDGSWVSRDQYMESQGYVKYRGKYITTQELELVEKTLEERQEEREWFHKVKLWIGWVGGENFASANKAREGWQALEAITDPNAAPAVIRFLSECEHREVRLLSVKILSQVGGNKPIPGLAKLSLQDPDHEVRYEALIGLKEQQFDRAIPIYLKGLRSDFNPIVCRSGTALGMIGGDKAVSPLIDALITSHDYQIRVPGSSQQSYSFSTNGNFATGSVLPPELQARISAGQYPNGVIVLDGSSAANQLTRTKVVTVTVNHQNAEVLTALQKLTGKNFGYDQRTWHLWWAAEKNQGGKGPLKS